MENSGFLKTEETCEMKCDLPDVDIKTEHMETLENLRKIIKEETSSECSHYETGLAGKASWSTGENKIEEVKVESFDFVCQDKKPVSKVQTSVSSEEEIEADEKKVKVEPCEYSGHNKNPVAELETFLSSEDQFYADGKVNHAGFHFSPSGAASKNEQIMKRGTFDIANQKGQCICEVEESVTSQQGEVFVKNENVEHSTLDGRVPSAEIKTEEETSDVLEASQTSESHNQGIFLPMRRVYDFENLSMESSQFNSAPDNLQSHEVNNVSVEVETISHIFGRESIDSCSDHATSQKTKRTYQCKFCQASFKRKDEYTIHERKHTGEQPFQCQVCKASFRSKSQCTDHERKHSGAGPYQCKFCQAFFKRKSHYIIHERKHTGERPFHCQICKASFVLR